MNKTDSVFVSIIHWNNLSSTRRCIKSLNSILSKNDLIYITDNHSQKEPFSSLATNAKTALQTITNTSNKGFAAAHNHAIKHALSLGFEYVLILNNDAVVTDIHLVKKLIAPLKADINTLATAPTIISDKNLKTVWYGGGELTPSGSHHLGVGKIYTNNTTEIQNVTFITGCCVMIRAKDYMPMEEKFFMYWEDADWCRQAQKNNKILTYVPDAHIYHGVSSSLGMRSPAYAYYNLRNHLFFIKKWTSKTAYINFFVIYAKYFLLTLTTTQKKRYVQALHDSLTDGVRGVGGQWSKAYEHEK